MSFAGSPDQIEGRLVPDAGFELDTLRTAGLPRCVSLQLIRSGATAAAAPWRALRILRRRQPHVVLGGGGFTGGPVLLAARILGIPAALTEADAHLGLANRLAAPLVARAFLAYPIDGRVSKRYAVVGRPIPARSRSTATQLDARRAFGLPSDGPVVLVVGGSQGARALNEAAVEAFSRAGPPILHLCGERDFTQLKEAVARSDYRLVPFTDEFGTALAACDLVVSRSGGTVWEIAAAGKPALLVPFPHATADHQRKNAAYFAAGGGAMLVSEPDLQLGPLVDELLEPCTRAKMSRAMRRLARPDAADAIAEELVRLGDARR